MIDSFSFISAAVSRLPESETRAPKSEIHKIHPRGRRRRLLRLMFQLSAAPDFIFHGNWGFLLGSVSSLIQLINCITWLNPQKKRSGLKYISSSTVHSPHSSDSFPFPISHFSLSCLAANLIKKFLHHFIPFLSFATRRLLLFSSAY